jgi:hypothetical protein
MPHFLYTTLKLPTNYLRFRLDKRRPLIKCGLKDYEISAIKCFNHKVENNLQNNSSTVE